jgi:hypothetical protein
LYPSLGASFFSGGLTAHRLPSGDPALEPQQECRAGEGSGKEEIKQHAASSYPFKRRQWSTANRRSEDDPIAEIECRKRRHQQKDDGNTT